MVWDFIFDVAKSVLSGVISDLIKGQIKKIFKADIEKEIADQLLKNAQREHLDDIQAIRRKVMDEIEILSARNPELIVSADEIRLKKPVKIPIIPIGKEKIIEKEIKLRLVELDNIIANRRTELGLPLLPQTNNAEEQGSGGENQGSSAEIIWEYDGKAKEPRVSKTQQEIDRLEETIRNRRSQ